MRCSKINDIKTLAVGFFLRQVFFNRAETKKAIQGCREDIDGKRLHYIRPVFYNVEEYLSFGEFSNMLDGMCYEKLLICDFLVLMMPEHIGMSTVLRMEQWFSIKKPVAGSWNFPAGIFFRVMRRYGIAFTNSGCSHSRPAALLGTVALCVRKRNTVQ